MGVLGLIGYLLYAAFFLLVIGCAFVEVFVLPQLADEAPRFVSDSLALFTGGDDRRRPGPAEGRSTPSRPSPTCSAGCCSGSRSTAPASSPAGPRCCSPSAPSPPSPCRSSRTRSTAWPRSPSVIALVGLGYSLMREQRAADVASPALDAGRCPVTRRWVPAALVALSVIPVFGGTARLVELIGRPGADPDRPPLRRLARSPRRAHRGRHRLRARRRVPVLRRDSPPAAAAGTAAPGACSRCSAWRSRSRACG